MGTRSEPSVGPGVTPGLGHMSWEFGGAREQFWEYVNEVRTPDQSSDSVHLQNAIFRFYLPMAHQEAYRYISDHALKTVEAMQAAELGLAAAVLIAGDHGQAKFEQDARAAIRSRLQRLVSQSSDPRIPRVAAPRIPHPRPPTP